MTRGQIEVLRLVAQSQTSKSFFDNYPYRRKIAKDLMWEGFLEHGGQLADDIVLTPAGRAVLQSEGK